MYPLLNESFLQFNPQAAAKIGLNDALLLQQIHELTFGPGDTVQGTQAFGRSYSEWQHALPFWSMATVIRAIKRLEKDGYIRTVRHNQGEKHYVVDYEVCEANAVTFFPPLEAEAMCIN